MKRMIGFLIVISCMLIVSVASALSLAVTYDDGVITYTVNDMSFPCELWLDGGNTGYGVLKNGTYTLERKLTPGEHTLVVASSIAGRASCRFTVPGNGNDPTATPIPTPTPAPTKTATSEPTKTPAPTKTATSEPTKTPAPTKTATSEPTKTPAPTMTPTPVPAPFPDETPEPEQYPETSDIVFSAEYADGKLTFSAQGNHGVCHILIDQYDTRRILSGEGSGAMKKKLADGIHKIQLLEEETGRQAEVILTIPHEVVLNWVKEPTCTEKGKAELICLNCEKVLETKESALMLHSFTLTKEDELVCIDCGEHFSAVQKKDTSHSPAIMYGEIYTEGVVVPAVSESKAIIVPHDDIIHFYRIGINGKEAGYMTVFWSEYSGSMLWMEITPSEGVIFDNAAAAIYTIGNEQVAPAALNVQFGSALPLEADAALIVVSGDGVYADTLLPMPEKLDNTADEMMKILETYGLNK